MKRVTHAFRALMLLSLTVTVDISPAQEGPLPPEHGYWSLGLENDLWGSGEDRHYTHGTKLAYLSPNPPPRWLQSFVRRFPCRPCRNAQGVQYVIGQNIFTPDDISIEGLITDDRPYAGWLYAGAQLIAPRELTPDFRRVELIQLDVGLVGPASLAEEAQKFFHRALATERPAGWGHQLENEPGLVMTYTRKWQYFGAPKFFRQLERDLSPHVVIAIGNVYTYAGGGVLFRIGKALRNDGGPETVRPSFPGFAYFGPESRRGWYVFTGIEARAVIRNIFLDGSTFADSHSVDKKPAVLDLQLGVALTSGRFRIAAANVWRSKEFDGQREPSRYGAITLSFRR